MCESEHMDVYASRLSLTHTHKYTYMHIIYTHHRKGLAIREMPRPQSALTQGRCEHAKWEPSVVRFGFVRVFGGGEGGSLQWEPSVVRFVLGLFAFVCLFVVVVVVVVVVIVVVVVVFVVVVVWVCIHPYVNTDRHTYIIFMYYLKK